VSIAIRIPITKQAETGADVAADDQRESARPLGLSAIAFVAALALGTARR
jgi:hypothetical protein